ncbi:unnamed protein product, partial [Ectocarpus sp. 12 AP-2014]
SLTAAPSTLCCPSSSLTGKAARDSLIQPEGSHTFYQRAFRCPIARGVLSTGRFGLDYRRSRHRPELSTEAVCATSSGSGSKFPCLKPFPGSD